LGDFLFAQKVYTCGYSVNFFDARRSAAKNSTQQNLQKYEMAKNVELMTTKCPRKPRAMNKQYVQLCSRRHKIQ